MNTKLPILRHFIKPSPHSTKLMGYNKNNKNKINKNSLNLNIPTSNTTIVKLVTPVKFYGNVETLKNVILKENKGKSGIYR